MVVKPKTRGFICTTAHPAGCEKNVERAAEAARSLRGTAPGSAPKNVLVIGSSTGYGLAGRVAAAFGYGAATVGVYLEKPPSGSRTASAGWYNDRAFRRLAEKEGLLCPSINADAFSRQAKEQAAAAIRSLPGGRVDLVVYSLAAPRRVDPATGETWTSVLAPVGAPFRGKTVDFHTGQVTEVEIAPAAPEAVEATVKVMGGEDWLLWIKALREEGVLAEDAATVAFSYIGPELTHAIYRDGTIGRAKEDLEKKAAEIDALLAPGGKAFVSVNKALVTQASAAIPVVPLYVSLLMRLMKEKGTHEDCTAQLLRLYGERLYRPENTGWDSVPVDGRGRIRMDDREMEPEIQSRISAVWESVSTETLREAGDLEGYRGDFYRLFGFEVPDVDYGADVDIS